jgi:putative ABC transport system permease protein
MAIRRLTRRGVGTFASVATLACGLAVSTVTWTLVSATLLRPLPVRALDRWFVVHTTAKNDGVRREFQYPALALIRDAGIFDQVIAAWVPLETLVLNTDGVSRRVSVGFVTGNYFSSLGLDVPGGRSFEPNDDRRGAPPVAVLTDRFWRRVFQASRRVIGGTVQVGASQATFVGVAPAGFRGLDLAEDPDLYLPLSVIADVASRQMNYFADPTHKSSPTAGLRIMARLRDGQSPAQAEVGLSAIASSLSSFDGISLGLEPLASATLGRDRHGVVVFSRMLMATVALMLLLACAAIAMSLLMAVEARRREFATRMALGAPVGTVLRSVTIEAACVSGVAALVALPVARALLVGLRVYSLPGGVSIDLLDVRLDGRAVLACLSTGAAAFFVLTAITRAYARGRLRSLTTSVLTTHGVGTARYGACTALLAVQVAVGLVLLGGAALFVRSLQSALDLNDPLMVRSVVASELDLSPYHYDASRAASFFEEWRGRMTATPAIADAAYSFFAGGMGPRGRLAVDGERRSFPSIVRFRAIDDAYLKTIGLALVDGRGFNAQDVAGAPSVAIVSLSLAKLVARNGSAVGHRIAIPASGETASVPTIVGVVPDVVVDVTVLQPLTIYLPIAQRTPGTYRTVTVRAAGDIDAARRVVAEAARSLDPGIALSPFPTMREEIERQMAPQRLGSAVLGILGGVALLLTGVGTYVLADSLATARTNEIGVRLALGATQQQIVALLLAGVMRPLGVGLAVGTALVWVGGGTLRALLFQVQPTDPWSLGQAVVLLATVAVIASLGPAIRAARCDVAGLMRQL